MNNQMNANMELQIIRNNPQMMQNDTVSNVMKLLDNKDRQGLIDLYKNTCKTTGNEPNPMFIQ